MTISPTTNLCNFLMKSVINLPRLETAHTEYRWGVGQPEDLTKQAFLPESSRLRVVSSLSGSQMVRESSPPSRPEWVSYSTTPVWEIWVELPQRRTCVVGVVGQSLRTDKRKLHIGLRSVKGNEGGREGPSSWGYGETLQRTTWPKDWSGTKTSTRRWDLLEEMWKRSRCP